MRPERGELVHRAGIGGVVVDERVQDGVSGAPRVPDHLHQLGEQRLAQGERLPDRGQVIVVQR